MSKKHPAAVLSFFVWGSGQFFICRQKLKGLLFFFCQLLLVGIEFNTGYWANYFAGEIERFEFRLYGGIFTKGIWGFITLGTAEGVGEDHSTLLMIKGILSIFVLLLFTGIFIWNILDAYRAGASIDRTKTYESSLTYSKKFKQKTFPYLVLIPIGIAVLFVVVLPILFTCLTAFTNYNRDHLPPANLIDWVGFSNFKKLFDVPVWSSTFFSVLGWTVVWALLSTFSAYFFGMFQALILNSKYVRFKSFFRTILILPWAIPAMISLLVFKNILNGQFGPMNQLLINWGIIQERIPFLTDAWVAKITLLVVNLWLGFPAFMVMIQGVLANIDKTLTEAARIDGAGEGRVFTAITLPLVFRTTAPLLIMNVTSNFNNFGYIYFLSEGNPVNSQFQFAGSTDILISWIYKLTLNQQMYSMAAVMSILIFIFVGVISIWHLRRTTSFKEA